MMTIVMLFPIIEAKDTAVHIPSHVPIAYEKHVPEIKPSTKNKIIVVKPEKWLSQKDINLIALVTMAEAEGESIKGQILVIDTILNRVDSPHFPNTVNAVIYQPSQFTSIWTSRIHKCTVKETICKLVRAELKHRTDKQVVFFRADRYSSYGVPLFKVGNHYFSKYK